MTDGLFTRMIQADPALSGVCAVLFDEFHERALEVDLGLAFTLETRSALRDDLRLGVMSATLDSEAVATLIGPAATVTGAGRPHPVETRHLDRPPPDRLADATARAVRLAVDEEPGSILVFLPGTADIRRVAERLDDMPETVAVVPLYGDLSLDQQAAAIRPAPSGTRKVVLATPIAETSLTIEGVRVVIDSGLRRVPVRDPASGMSALATRRISRAAAEQRRGRAGRTEPGVCYRLWPEAEMRGLAAADDPEILLADLAGFALDAALWGCRDISELALIDAPPAGPWAEANGLLHRLGAIGADGSITEHGRAMAGLGTHPRLAHMMLAARSEGHGRLATEIAALLEERDIVSGAARDSDLEGRLGLLQGGRSRGVDRRRIDQVRATATTWQRRLGIDEPAPPMRSAAGQCLALAYPERVARARAGRPGSFVMASGRAAVLDPGEPLAAEPFLAIADAGGDGPDARIHVAARIDRETIESLFARQLATEEEVAWDPRSEAVIARRITRLDRLVLEERAIARPDPEALAAALLKGVRAIGIERLRWTETARELQARVGFLRKLDPGGGWPDMEPAALADRLEDWLGPWVAGIARLSDMARVDLAAALAATLDWHQRQALDRLAPARVTVPSGREVPLDYSTGDTPVLSVKLQEMFGAEDTPQVADGRVPVTVALLSPAGRPLQTTQDLAGFWRTGYAAVRAEMRGRYPKHPWPDDPIAAVPARGTKKAEARRRG